MILCLSIILLILSSPKYALKVIEYITGSGFRVLKLNIVKDVLNLSNQMT
jgi:hypothetical protein